MKKVFNISFFIYFSFSLSVVLVIFFIYLRMYRETINKNLLTLHTQATKQSKTLDDLHTTLAEADLWSKAYHFFHGKKSEDIIKKIANQNNIDFSEYSESPNTSVETFSTFSINKITFCISFSTKDDDHFFSFVKKLKKSLPGFVLSRFIYLEKNYHKQTKDFFLKGNYHFECYYIMRRS